MNEKASPPCLVLLNCTPVHKATIDAATSHDTQTKGLSDGFRLTVVRPNYKPPARKLHTRGRSWHVEVPIRNILAVGGRRSATAMLPRRVKAGLVDCRAPRFAVVIRNHAKSFVDLSRACHDDASRLARDDNRRRVADAHVLSAGSFAVHNNLAAPRPT